MDLIAGERWRWGAAAAGAFAVVAGVLFLFRVPAAPIGAIAPTPTEKSPASHLVAPSAPVVLAKAGATDAVLAEEMALRDMRPLFLPTQWNAALREPRLEPGRTFLDNETVKLGFAVADLQLTKALPPVATINGKAPEEATPLDGLTHEVHGPTLVGFGRAEVTVTQAKARGGLIEVVAMATGQTIVTAPLDVSLRPPTDKSWSPMELLAVIDAAGLALPLEVTESSRVDEVDKYFQKFLVQRFRIGERLTPGFYRIVVGP